MIVTIRRRYAAVTPQGRRGHGEGYKILLGFWNRNNTTNSNFSNLLRASDRDFQGTREKLVFGALSPVSVSAARQRLDARGRRGHEVRCRTEFFPLYLYHDLYLLGA